MARIETRQYEVRYTVSHRVRIPDTDHLRAQNYENVRVLLTNQVLSDDIARQHRLLRALLDNEDNLDQFLRELSVSIVADGFITKDHVKQHMEEDVLERQARQLEGSEDVRYFKESIRDGRFIEELDHFFECIETSVERQLCDVAGADE